MEAVRRESFTRTFNVGEGREVKIFQNQSKSECGGVIWDGALVFIHLLLKHPHGFADYLAPTLDLRSKPLKVLDLGAGTGALGIVFAKMFDVEEMHLSDIEQ